jgi:hypothetical protein
MRAALAVSVALFVLPCLVAAAQEYRKVELPARAWGEEQATGAPNTDIAGDRPTAWASASPDGEDEWLELTYAEEVAPVAVMVYETYNPGALYRVCGFTGSGMEAELWSGEDPTPRSESMGVSEVKIETKFKTKRVRIYLKSKEVPGWNEIDAVGLKDADGKMHWAVSATASSCYASPRSTTAEVIIYEGSGLIGGSTPPVSTFGPVVTSIREPAPAVDPRDERIEKLEKEVAELRKLLEELIAEQKRPR